MASIAASASAGGGESAAARRRFALAAAAIFAVLTVPRLLAHELWRDEAWQWLVVRESHSLGQLFDGTSRGGGVGYVFPLLCYAARQLSTSPRAMQIVHLGLATAAAFVFARWAPLQRRERALLVLGYFPFYEYAVISRSYSASALLLWLACAAAAGRWPLLVLGAAVALLCQTTVYGFILAIALGAGWLVRQRIAPEPRAWRWSDAASAGAVAAAGAIAGLVQLHQAPGTRVPGWRFDWVPVAALKPAMMAWRAFVPVPRLQLGFWNSNVLDPWPLCQALAGLSILALGFALLWRSKAAVTTFAVGAAGLLAFSYLVLQGEMRHHGNLWLLFTAALWLGGGAGFLDEPRSWRAKTLLAMLAVQCAAAAYASWMDLRHPFSNGAATAALIRAEGLDRFPLLGHREPPAATVALYLERPLYAPSRKVYTTHPDWGPRQRELSEPEVRCAARELARREARDVVLVVNRTLPPWPEVAAAGARTGAIVRSEDYHLYRLRHDALAATAQDAACAAGD
ncbi:MAG TPA: hypothetical protein VGS57_14695 [Thermoanaerobaculia bacterium]|nr:hypothetical protein [Thermoanaerobaculia bacterium]